ncbi:RAD3-like DNA-binding helicase protein, partial [Striga asiatica]
MKFRRAEDEVQTGCGQKMKSGRRVRRHQLHCRALRRLTRTPSLVHRLLLYPIRYALMDADTAPPAHLSPADARLVSAFQDLECMIKDEFMEAEELDSESSCHVHMQSYKLIKTHDVVETTLAMDNYCRACDCEKGAGKMAEGIDFDRHYGKLVIMLGVSFQYTLSRIFILMARLEYLRETFQIKEYFISYMLSRRHILLVQRQAAQCVGCVIRPKVDYGMMIFAGKRIDAIIDRVWGSVFVLGAWGRNFV